MTVMKYILPSREKWLKTRQGYIGGSDAAACLGLNPYKNNVTLWKEKVGLKEPVDISDKPYVRYGIRAEEHLRELFSLDFPEYEVIYDENNLFTNSEYPFMHASLDGELIDLEGRRGILEIKTTEIQQGAQKEQWRDRLPDHYYCQLLHYLVVTEWDFAVLKAQLKSQWDGELQLVTKHYKIERKDVEEDVRQLIKAEKEFWRYVEEQKEPPLILPRI